MTKNRIPRRNLSERTQVVSRLLQERAYATYGMNVLVGARIDQARENGFDVLVLDEVGITT